MVVNRGNFGSQIWPGINKNFWDFMDSYPEVWPGIFSKNTSTMAFEKVQQLTGMGLPREITEGGPIQYSDFKEGYQNTFTHVKYGMGFIITREAFDDNVYGTLGKQRSQGLAFSMKQNKETIGANIFNRAFTSTYAYGDGKELCATDHPNKNGGTWANEPTTASDLNETALQQAIIDIRNFKTDAGLKISVQPRFLLVPPSTSMFQAERLFKSTQRVETANNDVNVVKSMNLIPEGYRVWQFLTDSDAWFIITNFPNGFMYFQRRALDFGQENDFDTENAKFKAVERYSFGCSDPRSVYGSPGA